MASTKGVVSLRAAGDDVLLVTVKVAPPDAEDAQRYGKALIEHLALVCAALAAGEGVARQVTQVRTNFSHGTIEIDAVVLHAQTPQQVQRDLLAAIAPQDAV